MSGYKTDKQVIRKMARIRVVTPVDGEKSGTGKFLDWNGTLKW